MTKEGVSELEDLLTEINQGRLDGTVGEESHS